MEALASGYLFANRFEIDQPIGSGGMGTVYRARDRYSGDWVALKLLHSTGDSYQESQRFLREALLLSELHHPGIVSYVAHGQAPDGRRFLAMEWLEGEDLARRLARGPLSLRDCAVLLKHAAAGLAVAHQRGIVHRDLKPTNLFLQGGDVARVKILDFGIARRLTEPQAMTRTGTVIGTPEYMAPEQARGVRDLTPAADIFSLGCVLYESLTGQAPFIADHIAAVLVRILLDEPTPVEEHRPGIPDSLSALLKWLLHKDAAQRPPDASALLEAIPGLGEFTETAFAPTVVGPQRGGLPFAESEQGLLSVVLAALPTESADRDMMLNPSDLLPEASTRDSLLSALRTLGVSAEILINGALVVTMPQMTSVTDQVTLAARAALLIKERWPAAVVSMATGRGSIQGRRAVGEVVEQAAKSLGRRGSSAPSPQPASGVFVDELSARLLEGRFAQTLNPDGARLLNQEKDVDESRLLLGKPTPCVGRDLELGLLEGQLTSCVEDQEARALLITAPPGIGKSRLRHEFLRRVTQRSEQVTVLLGRGDLMTAGAPYGILSQALRKLFAIDGGEPLDAQRSRLAQRVREVVEETESARVIHFLGELCGVPFPTEGSRHLSAARVDPQTMHDQVRRAFVDWLRAECGRAAALVVLDDLQWGDSLSVGLMDGALHELRSAPLFVLALARPEVREVFPKLWPGHYLHELPLKGLSRKACERLAQQVLGKQAAPDRIARIVEQCTGNALFLEELIRAVGEGQSDREPETVVAMLQARIGRFEPGARRAARAASIFGQTFWRGGVAALLGIAEGMPESGELDRWLRALVEAEMIQPHTESRFAREVEYGFRHALMREAAYSLLTASDHIAGHKLAASYLTQMGEPEPLVLADHYHRGGEPEQALALYLQAVEDAARAGALDEARLRCARARSVLAELADSAERRRTTIDLLLRQVQLGLLADSSEQNLERMAEARSLLTTVAQGGGAQPADQRRSAWIDVLCGRIHHYRGEPLEALKYGSRALPIAEALGDEQLLAIHSQLIGAAMWSQGRFERSHEFLARALEAQHKLDNDFERSRSLSGYAIVLVARGRYLEGMRLHEQSLAHAAENKLPASLTLIHMNYAISLRICGAHAALLDTATSALKHAEKSGDLLVACGSSEMLSWAHSALNQPREARYFSDKKRQLEEELGSRLVFSDWYAASDAEIALRTGDIERALATAELVAAECHVEERFLGLGLAEQVWGLALGRRDAMQAAEAEAHLMTALEVMESTGQVMAAAILRLEWADLCRRRGLEARAAELRAQGVAQFEASGCAHLIEGIERAAALG